MTTNNEAYQGWSNRETWACSHWLNNEQGLQKDLHEFANGTAYDLDIERADALEEYVHSGLFDYENLTPDLYLMREDIGSLWRVNWAEIIENARDES